MQTASALNALAGQPAAARKNEAKDINDRFLKLLIAQMNNQDPLNPLDNAQVTTQMAQINTVTGINNLTETMARLTEQFTVLQTLQAAQLAGRDVLVAGDRLQLAGGAAGGAVELAQPAGSLAVDIFDGKGTLVRTLELGARGPGTVRFDWDGQTASGAAAAAGSYTFIARAVAGGTEFAAATLMRGRVEGVRNVDGAVQLMLSGVGAVAYSDVKQIL